MADDSESAKRQAQRSASSRLRQPRLMMGVTLIVGSIVIGALLVNRLDSTQEYWALSESVTAGSQVDPAVLVVTNARLDNSVAETVVPTSELFSDEAVWTANLEAGALVPRYSVGHRSEAGFQLPLTVPAGSVPQDLAAGDIIDVWVGPGPQADPSLAANQVLTQVRVVSTAVSTVSNERTVVVDVGTSEPDPVTISAVVAAHVTIVRRP